MCACVYVIISIIVYNYMYAIIMYIHVLYCIIIYRTYYGYLQASVMRIWLSLSLSLSLFAPCPCQRVKDVASQEKSFDFVIGPLVLYGILQSLCILLSSFVHISDREYKRRKNASQTH